MLKVFKLAYIPLSVISELITASCNAAREEQHLLYCIKVWPQYSSPHPSKMQLIQLKIYQQQTQDIPRRNELRPSRLYPIDILALLLLQCFSCIACSVPQGYATLALIGRKVIYHEHCLIVYLFFGYTLFFEKSLPFLYGLYGMAYTIFSPPAKLVMQLCTIPLATA